MSTASGVPVALVQASALIGVGLPLVAAFLKQDHFSKRTNTLIAVAVAVVAAIVTTAAKGELDVQNVVGSFTAIYTVSMAFYHGLWNPTGLEPALKTRTSTRRNVTLKTRRPSRTAVGSETGTVPAP
jgi:cytochrome c biogenesis factor